MSQARARHGRRAGLSLTSAVTLAAIASVVALVSVSRLRGFVVRENEQDALSAVRLLAERLPLSAAATPPALESLVRGGPLARRLPDAAFLEDGRVMQCHGYLFEVVALEPAAPWPGERTVRAAAPASWAVRAWPCVAGETGTSALLATTDGTVLGHPNAERRWGGAQAPPPLPASATGGTLEGWRALR